MDFTQTIEPASAVFVLTGTLAATVLRCGWKECGVALRALAALPKKPFDKDSTRKELAAQIREIGEDGFLRAEPHHFGDGEFDAVADRLISQRSVQGLHDEHRRHREKRLALSERARDVLLQAAELAPVLGLAGTLLSLGGLAGGEGGSAGIAASIGMAVGTTFFGLICAHFLFAPLAAAIARRSAAEEQARQELIDWLAAGIEAAVRPMRPMPPVPDHRDAA
jgi:chemotaxis protein MotA